MIIQHIQYYLPNKRVPIHSMQKETGLSSEMLSIFEKIYGLKEVLVAENISILNMLSETIEKLIKQSHVDINKIKYVIHAHTSSLLIPFGTSLVQKIKEKFKLKNAYYFGTTTQKCVSALKVFELLSALLNTEEEQYALLLTGEIAFTPQLRLIPRSGISGDAATAILICSQGSDHVLLAIEVNFFPGYCKGVYLSDQEMQEFDQHFLVTMKKTIVNTLKKSHLSLENIKWIFPHNINLPTWKKIAQILPLPLEKIYLDSLSWTGHCFASDGILNLAFALEKNLLQKGDFYLIASCGVGFYFGCAAFQF